MRRKTKEERLTLKKLYGRYEKRRISTQLNDGKISGKRKEKSAYSA